MLGPALQRDVVDLDATLRQPLLEIPVRQPEAQIPPDRQHDHIGREPVAREGRSSDLDWVAAATPAHTDSLMPPSPPSQRNRADIAIYPGEAGGGHSSSRAVSANRRVSLFRKATDDGHGSRRRERLSRFRRVGVG
jgi:hypothetical protein